MNGNSHLGWTTRALLLGGLAALAALPVTAGADPAMTDIALELGFQDRLGHGRAQVAADFNGDGWTDFYIGNPSVPALGNDDSFIVWNLGPDGEGDFQFEKGPVLVQGVAAFGASAADYDNDGDPDLFIAVGGQETVGFDRLFRNDGGSFTDVSLQAGIRGPRDANGNWVMTASLAGHWADYDKDGDLDLFVPSKYLTQAMARPDGLGYRDSLFRNDGDGTFTDVSVASGLVGGVSTKTASWGDYDNDGWVDLFIPIEEYLPISPHDFRLFRNNQDGTFVEMPLDEGALGVGTRTWASCNADFDQDGWLDIIVLARFRPANQDSHVLLMNQGGWTFTNAAESSGLAPAGVAPPTVMGCQLGDLDNNGYVDVIMANGGPGRGDRDVLLLNEYSDAAGVVFRDASHLIDYPAPDDPGCVPPESGERESRYIDGSDMSPARADDRHAIDSGAIISGGDPCVPAFPYRGHAITYTDFDKDGDVDLPMIKGGTEIIAPDLPSGEPNRFFRNDGGNSLNWLFVDLHGTVSNEQGIGARVEVVSRTAAGGTRSLFEDARAGRCFAASGPRELHFGLGTDTAVDAIRVWWPSGMRTTLNDVQVNQRVRIDEAVIASSDFNDGNAPGWTALSGNWAVVNGAYVQSQPGRTVAVSGSDLSDYSVVGKLTYRVGQRKMSLLGRVSADGDDYYAAVLAGSTAQIYTVTDGALTPLGEPLPIETMTRGKSYIVSLQFSGSLISMTVDGLSTDPVSDGTYASGRIGLATDNTGAAFDNIAVY